MKCAMCGRRLLAFTHKVSTGPVGPKCAAKAGMLGKRVHRAKASQAHGEADPNQSDWINQQAG